MAPVSSASGTFRGLQPFLQPWAEWLLSQAGPNAHVTSVRRSRKQQTLLYRRYLAGLSQFPAAPPGTSKHERGLAFDIYSSDSRVLERLGKLWESVGGTWGGRFRDPIHFEV